MAKRALTDADLMRHLSEQLGFLEDSGRAFDEGRDGEAKRLAVTLRVLLHDTEKARSLLSQLGRKSGLFWDSAGPDNPRNLLPFGGLVGMRIGPADGRYFALLDDTPIGRHVAFDEWWNAVVFRDQSRTTTLSRRDLVLTAANQDGGAHVDPALDERYARFARDNAMGWSYSDGQTEKPMDGAVGVAIRQIAHEVLRSLVPGYRKSPPNNMPGRDMALPHVSSSAAPSVIVPEVGRNDPCPCGSTKKYKKCHGA